MYTANQLESTFIKLTSSQKTNTIVVCLCKHPMHLSFLDNILRKQTSLSSSWSYY